MTPGSRSELELQQAPSASKTNPQGNKRVDPVLMLGGALALGGVAVTHPRWLIVAVLSLLLLTWRHTRWPTRALVVPFVLLGAARASLTLGDYDRAWHEARAWVVPGSRCIGHGEVIASPVLRGDRLGVTARLELECDARQLPRTQVVRLYGGPDSLGRGDQIHVVSQLSPVQILRNLELPDPRPGAARGGVTLSGSVLSLEIERPGRGIGHRIDGARGYARRRITQTFDPLAAPMARALVLGENDLDAEDDSAFRKSGLSHLLAVSGTHLVFAVVSLVTALQALLTRLTFISSRYHCGRIAALIGCPLALAYADYAGGSGSAWRAAFMLCAVFAARALERRAGPARSLGWSFVAGALVDPLVCYDVSFLLSAAATVGLVCIGSPALAWAETWSITKKSKVIGYLAASIMATVGSMLPCAPLLAVLSPDLTLAGILANVVAAPLGEIIALPLCLAHILAAPVPVLEQGMAKAAGGALLVVRQVAHWSAAARSMAFAVPPPTAAHLWVLGCTGLGALLAAWRRRWRATWLWVAALVLGSVGAEALARYQSRPRGELRIAQLDVGQGDSALVDLPDGKLMLIDGGGSAQPEAGFDPGRRVILPVLRARRRRRVDVVLITHPHPDHYGGLPSVLQEAQVAEIWDSSFPGGKTYERLLRSGPRVRHAEELCARYPAGGHPDRGYLLEVLGPCPGSPELDANDNSIVLRLSVGKRRFLFTGDAEAAQEAQLLEQHGGDLQADWLKAGHHGSRTSSSAELLQHVAPALVGISCGVRNGFGHPHQEALERIQASGAEIWRIDDAGSLELNLVNGTLYYGGFAWGDRGRELPAQPPFAAKATP
ncbi:MAG: DNA internalization-related competence protein ComEC/Rec2 [Polyangiaceae bacterium]|nr:DNA internalization-related competence protein ComEC/Rec2 [Myxococcales bacterium]MCB9587735.1 DNA internalization-related competence protein ComEC/Rec2 [Polyangiaceae bacterium]